MEWTGKGLGAYIHFAEGFKGELGYDWCLHIRQFFCLMLSEKCWFVWCLDPHYTVNTALIFEYIYEIRFGVQCTVDGASTIDARGSPGRERSPAFSAHCGGWPTEVRAPAIKNIQKSRLRERKSEGAEEHIVFYKAVRLYPLRITA